MRWTDINNINQRIDNPTFQDKVIAEHLAKYFKFPFLEQKGHRKVNHDILTAVRLGYANGGVQGIEAYLLHHMQDMISDQLVKTVGSDSRDIIEALINFDFSRHRRHTAPRRLY